MAGNIAFVLAEVRLNRGHRVGCKRRLTDSTAPIDLFQTWREHEHGFTATTTGAGHQLNVDVERRVTSFAGVTTNGLDEW